MLQTKNSPFPILLTAVASAILATTSLAQQPNIIHIMVDDAGTGDFTSYYHDSPVQTPNLDALAADGLRFTRAYAGATNCAPSRSALMTGMHGGHSYMRSNGGTVSIRDQEVTIAEVLQTAGYATGGYGKWGLGSPGTPGVPERQGFDEFVGYYNQTHAHYHYPDRIYDSGRPLRIPENDGFSEPETGLISNSRVHAHSIIFDRMRSFIQTNIQEETPFYTWGAWTPPHRRSTLPQSEAEPGGLYDIYRSAHPEWDDRAVIQAGFVTWIDSQVGELRSMLEDPNGDGDSSDSVAGNTLILFTSDNGGWNGGHPWDRNAETVGGQYVDLRRDKEDNHEGGLRTPMIAYWPGMISPGTESDLITYFPDLMPTFAELAGATAAVPAGIDGLSIAPTLTGTGTQDVHDGIYFEDYSYDTNRSTPEIAVRMADWKLIRRHDGSMELFNLAADPSETTNQYNNAAYTAQRNQLTTFMNDNHTPITAQFALNPPNVGTSNATRDGIQEYGIRPADHLNRDWSIAESGDALMLEGTVVDGADEIVELYLDDLHQDYELEMTVERIGSASPVLQIELLGDSGIAYYSSSYETDQQGPDTSINVILNLQITSISPDASQLSSDIEDGLMLRISHDGAASEINVSNVLLSGGVPIGPVFGDLNVDGILDVLDWYVLRDNLFSELSGLTVGEAFEHGDLNGDFYNNELDFLLFKAAYENAYGDGSFAELLTGVPEPSSCILLLVATVGALIRRRI